ncbi:hypothetical protein TRVL_00496 [Trypanosoma vivax]|nr:hypothetical protein TRVL_00496 [Trypanosoma vivax]
MNSPNAEETGSVPFSTLPPCEHEGASAVQGGRIKGGEEEEEEPVIDLELGTSDDDGDQVLLRNDISEFTPEEIKQLAALELGDHDYHHVNSSGSYGGDARTSSGGVQEPHKWLSAPSVGSSARKTCTLRQLLPRHGHVGGTDAMADAVLQEQRLHVADHGLRDTLPIECFLNLTHLYMQHNEVTSLEGLVLLAQLQVLVVHHNAVESLRPLAQLSALSFVDARNNRVVDFTPGKDLPCESLKYLALLENPCCSGGDIYREQVLQCCPHLEMLDNVVCRPRSVQQGINCGASLVVVDEVKSEEDGEGMGEDSDSDSDSEADRDDLGQMHAGASSLDGRMARSNKTLSRVHFCRSLKMSKPRRLKIPSSNACSGMPHNKYHDLSTTERFCRQFQHRSSAIRQIAGDHALGTTSHSHSFFHGPAYESDDESKAVATLEACTQVDNRLSSSSSSSHMKPLPAALLQERATKSRLYDDIHFALEADTLRLQQLAESVWDDVEKVLRTRQAVVDHRRRRIDREAKEPSSSYAQSLEVLQRESDTKDLDGYRKPVGRSGAPTQS